MPSPESCGVAPSCASLCSSVTPFFATVGADGTVTTSWGLQCAKLPYYLTGVDRNGATVTSNTITKTAQTGCA
jgi:hypothetical protein